ncbi:hypothetical protein J2Z21_000754 [Streptomyces griseochromogenes]|uniref:Transposase n=1 Tax=Streptomyces griseochromogenes TaxID=68214 RepID=A0ABS4LKB0_9ACTN|nr:hypothetical protein [Streptomyces griseochromogenes]
MSKAPGAVATAIDSQSVKAAETVGRDSRGPKPGRATRTWRIPHRPTPRSSSAF